LWGAAGAVGKMIANALEAEGLNYRVVGRDSLHDRAGSDSALVCVCAGYRAGGDGADGERVRLGGRPGILAGPV
jgi:nucleoside-diphosphate-sugar epimerase